MPYILELRFTITKISILILSAVYSRKTRTSRLCSGYVVMGNLI